MLENNFFVVGIGASAGGLRALEEFFDYTPSDSNVAFIVIQHLSPDFKSLMKELLSRRTRMEVHRVEQGMAIAPNNVYLILPGKNLSIDSGVLHLSEQQSRKVHGAISFPINIFFNSLADSYADRSVGIVLSGTGSDGTQGLQTIKEAGGTVLVQDPETAEFNGMPHSAISTGIVDRILAPRELAQLVYELVNSSLDRDISRSSSFLLDYAKISKITNILVEHDYIDFSYYKKTTLSRRIHRRCSIVGCTNIDRYIKLLANSQEERNILSNELLINVTRFFRDPIAWSCLEKNVIVPLIENAKSGDELRFWVAACSTGEEAYSLGILIDENIADLDKKLKIKIFATDVDRLALEKAAAGSYAETIGNDLAPERLQKYFVYRNGSYNVTRQLREMMIFAPHNLAKDAGFTRMHLVTCRNMLIYLEPDLQQQVIRNIHFSLAAKGMLFLGEAENLGALEDEFTTVDKKWKIYQKRRDVRLPLAIETYSHSGKRSLPRSSIQTKTRSPYEPMLEETLKTILKDRQALCLIVDRQYQLLHVYGDSQGILTIPQGKLSREIINMVVPALKLPLNTALHRAKKEEQPVIYTGIKLDTQERDSRQVSLKVTYQESNKLAGDFLVINIESDIKPQNTKTGQPFELDNEASQRIAQLEFELNQTRENLQAVIEELETTNEEQQATNEELVASNEELQSTNEELHSVNEELHTVNREYQSKIQQLIELNNDVDNLLKSTDIGVVFLDIDLRIRKFTTAATKAISLVESDKGRPLAHLSHNMDVSNLIELLSEAIATEKPIEREVALHNRDENLLMRINPYRTENDVLDGVVITFVDISDICEVQEQLQLSYRHLQQEIQAKQKIENSLRESEERFRSLIETSSDWVWEIDRDANYTYVSPKVRELLGYEPEEILGTNFFALMSEAEAEKIRTQFDLIAERHQPFECLVNINRHRDGHQVILETSGVPIFDRDNNWCGYRGIDRDVSEKQKYLTTIERNLSLLQTIINATPDIVFVKDKKGRYQWANEALAKAIGRSVKDIISKRDRELFPKSVSDKIEADDRVIFESCQISTYEETIRVGDRNISYLTTKTVYYDNHGVPLGIVGIARDINNFKEAEAVLQRTNLELEQRVNIRTSELAKAKEIAEAANQAKSIFIANMSHELRTPLNSILGFAQILLQHPEADPQRQNQIATIYQSGKHLLTLINDILHLAKIEAGKLELQPKKFNFQFFVDRLLAIMQINAQSKNIALDYQPLSQLPTVIETDQTRLRQVLLNLLANAVKFTETGGVTLRIGYVRDFPDARSDLDGGKTSTSNKIRFEIEDTGIGIEPEILSDIFIPFQQSVRHHTSHEGTGLGLTISQNIIREMGSQIEVTSTPQKGSTFWFDLELSAIESDSCQLSPIASLDLPIACEGEKPTILIVDDNENNRSLLASLFGSFDFPVLEAGDGETGLSLALQYHPDVIIFDYALPGIDGREMLAQIERQWQSEHITIIGSSALTLKPSDRIGDIFLPKPIDLKKMIGSLATHLKIKWIYPKQLPQSQDNLAIDTNTIIMPSKEELTSWLVTVKQGDILKIQQQAKELQLEHPEYQQFSKYILDLTEDFQLTKLRQFIQKAIAQT